MKMTVKEFIGVMLTIIGFIGIMFCIISSLVFMIRNPDMTELRRFIEYLEPIVGGVLSFLIVKIGTYLVTSSNK